MRETGEATDTAAFERLLEQVRAERGFDFTGYKRSSLVRRTRRRMADLGVADFEQYAQRLESDAAEFDALFTTILINVTSFFRDPSTWRVLEQTVLPDLIERDPAHPIRIWSAGCATGQEAYSVAMLLAEALGADR